MEKEILEILKSIQLDIKGLKESQERLENKIDGVVEQTADLLEFRTQITDTVQPVSYTHLDVYKRQQFNR